MQNDYLNNKKNYSLNHLKINYPIKQKILKPKNVDINELLNGVKINEKNKKKERLVFFGLATLLVGVMGIFITI
jgi:hypothetical protein